MPKSKAVCRPSRNESAMRLGKKRSPVTVARWARRQLGQHVGAEQMAGRVVAEERREERRDRWQV